MTKTKHTQQDSTRPILSRVMSFKNYVGLGFGAIIGMGWVIYSGEWLASGGPLGAILGFIIGGILLVPIGMCYAELTSAIPVSGGEIGFAYKAFGPGIAFLSAWLLAFAYTCICPFETVALGWIFEQIIPVLRTAPLYSIGDYAVSWSSLIPGMVIAVGVTVMNYRGVKTSARFQTFTVALMVLCVAGFTVVALLKGDLSNLRPLFAGTGALQHIVPVSILSIVVGVPFWLSGFDTIPQAAEESNTELRPKHLGMAIILSIVGGFLFYAFIILAVGLSLPWQETITLSMPTADVFYVAFGYTWAAKLVLVAAFLGLLTSLNGFFVAATRIFFAAGRGGLLPSWFAVLHREYHTPRNAVLFVGGFALVGPFVGKASLSSIVHIGSLVFISAWVITALSAIRLRKTEPSMARPYRVRRKFILYLAAIVGSALTLLMVIPGSPEQLLWPVEYAMMAIWLLTGWVFYRSQKRRGDLSCDEQAYLILGELHVSVSE